MRGKWRQPGPLCVVSYRAAEMNVPAICIIYTCALQTKRRARPLRNELEMQPDRLIRRNGQRELVEEVRDDRARVPETLHGGGHHRFESHRRGQDHVVENTMIVQKRKLLGRQ